MHLSVLLQTVGSHRSQSKALTNRKTSACHYARNTMTFQIQIEKNVKINKNQRNNKIPWCLHKLGENSREFLCQACFSFCNIRSQLNFLAFLFSLLFLWYNSELLLCLLYRLTAKVLTLLSASKPLILTECVL